MLADKRLLITGIVNTESIAFATARTALLQGAEVVLTAFPRDRELAERAAAALPGETAILDADLTDAGHIEMLTESLARTVGTLDGALHAVAYAPKDALAEDFLAASAESVNLAFQTSAYSYASLARVLRALAPERGASLVGLDFDAKGAWPVYNWMGVCKAALESINRYLARALGPRGIRANLIAAGPLHTRAAGGIPEFERLTDAWEAGAPMAWDPRDPQPVADAAAYLMSDLSAAITGEILHVDGGYHAMAGPLRPAGVTANGVSGAALAG